MRNLQRLIDLYDGAPLVIYDRARNFRVAVNFTDPADRQWAIDHDVLMITAAVSA